MSLLTVSRIMVWGLAASLVAAAGCGRGEDSSSANGPKTESAPAASASGSPKFDAFIEATRQEAAKQKTVYIRVPGIKDKSLRWTEEALKNRFGIDVTLVNDPKGWDEITAAYIAEYQAGKKDVPIIAGYGNTMFGSVEEAGALADIDWAGTFGEKWPVIKEINEAVTWPQLRKGCVTITWRTYVLYYNKDLIKDSQAPRKWADLFDPKFKGKISAFANGAPGEYLRSVWGEEKVLDWAKKIKANNPIFLESSPAIASGVASGEVGIGTINLQYAQAQVEKGAPVGWMIPEDGWVNLTDVFCTFKHASHPKLSALLAAFWATAPEELAGRIRTTEGWTVGFPDWSYGTLPAQMKKQGLTFKDMREVSDKETATLDRKFRDRIAKEAYRTLQ
ncbi:MAG TPA: extracellular solute-binding protein [Candidatus Binatia bacterium]|jgi:iron(III) transport system substrate-binding protein